VGSFEVPVAAKGFDMNRLYKKIYGCEAVAAIANSMGDVTEGMTYQQIDEE
jgi:hypothetical protein